MRQELYRKMADEASNKELFIQFYGPVDIPKKQYREFRVRKNALACKSKKEFKSNNISDGLRHIIDKHNQIISDLKRQIREHEKIIMNWNSLKKISEENVRNFVINLLHASDETLYQFEIDNFKNEHDWVRPKKAKDGIAMMTTLASIITIDAEGNHLEIEKEDEEVIDPNDEEDILPSDLELTNSEDRMIVVEPVEKTDNLGLKNFDIKGAGQENVEDIAQVGPTKKEEDLAAGEPEEIQESVTVKDVDHKPIVLPPEKATKLVRTEENGHASIIWPLDIKPCNRPALMDSSPKTMIEPDRVEGTDNELVNGTHVSSNGGSDLHLTEKTDEVNEVQQEQQNDKDAKTKHVETTILTEDHSSQYGIENDDNFAMRENEFHLQAGTPRRKVSINIQFQVENEFFGFNQENSNSPYQSITQKLCAEIGSSSCPEPSGEVRRGEDKEKKRKSATAKHISDLTNLLAAQQNHVEFDVEKIKELIISREPSKSQWASKIGNITDEDGNTSNGTINKHQRFLEFEKSIKLIVDEENELNADSDSYYDDDDDNEELENAQSEK